MGIKDSIIKAYSSAKSAACGFADTVKSEYKKGQLKNELEELYETLGQVRYSEMLEGGETSEESVKLCEEIARVKSELAVFDTPKNEDPTNNLCAFCGKKLPNSITYCPYCGEKTKNEDLNK